jgi:hypothetical protein
MTLLEKLDECNAHGKRYYKVRCWCDNVFKVVGSNIVSGNTRSCGCDRYGKNARHGHTRGGKFTKEYRTWAAVITRCTNPNADNYARYGGKGTRVTQEWIDSFEAFFEHIGYAPTPRHTIDRIDPFGHYEPGNVRWATYKEQRANRRDSQ